MAQSIQDTDPKALLRQGLMRAYSTPASHRPIPMRAMMPVIRLRTERWWRVHPSVLADARRQMRYLVDLQPGLDAEALAKPYLFELQKLDELRWRPWLTTRMPVSGADNANRFLRQGVGVIFNFLHHGQYGGVAGSLSRTGIRLHVAIAAMFLGDQSQDYEGRKRRQHFITATCNGIQCFDSRGSYDHMRDLLIDGEAVLLASDIPGSTPMTILNRRVMAASGAARLSLETGSPIVPVVARRKGCCQELIVEEPILPGDHVDVASIQDEIGRRHEPGILAWPEAMKAPLSRWKPSDPQDAAEFGFSDAEAPAQPVAQGRQAPIKAKTHAAAGVRSVRPSSSGARSGRSTTTMA